MKRLTKRLRRCSSRAVFNILEIQMEQEESKAGRSKRLADHVALKTRLALLSSQPSREIGVEFASDLIITVHLLTLSNR